MVISYDFYRFAELFKNLSLLIEKSQKINYASVVANAEESIKISGELQVYLQNSIYITKKISLDLSILAKYMVKKKKNFNK